MLKRAGTITNMRNIIITLFLVAGFTNTGTYLLGFSAETQTKGFGSEWLNGEMIKYFTFDGEEHVCSIDERYMMQNLYILENN